jgi:hypothetical protein
VVQLVGYGPELVFYHDEEEHIEQPKRPRKPVKTKYISQEEYDLKIKEWEASAPHPVKVKPMGNSMTGKYYSEKILPGLIEAIYTLCCRHNLKYYNHYFVLQEDNDKSHGHTAQYRPDSLQDRIKKAANIHTIIHPARLPDLNPQEAVWNILKERVRKRTWHSLEEYKRVIQHEYSLITLAEVRARIAEMPWRMEQVKKYPDKPIKSDLW